MRPHPPCSSATTLNPPFANSLPGDPIQPFPVSVLSPVRAVAAAQAPCPFHPTHPPTHPSNAREVNEEAEAALAKHRPDAACVPQARGLAWLQGQVKSRAGGEQAEVWWWLTLRSRGL